MPRGYRQIIQNWNPTHLGHSYRLGEYGPWSIITDETEFGIFIESSDSTGWIPTVQFYEDSGLNNHGEPYIALPLWLFADHERIP